ncbi:MAG: glycosyltransferase [Streptomyces sp.]|uniref:glycosyltransferase n=1 Tax=Streptomyces sp. TaxID=1931 RepID=UPI003D6BF0BA
MKVAHVVTLVSDGGAYGGPVSVATAQLGELAARGHRTVLLSLWRGRAAVPHSWDGVPLRARRARALVPGTGFLGLLNPRLLTDLWHHLGRADLVHVHAGRDLVSLSALAVAALRRRPLVVQTHGMVQPRGGALARLFDRLYVPLLRRARACLVLTEEEGAGLARVLGPGGPPLHRVRNGVARRPAAARSEQPTPEVLFLARLHPVKRPEAFVEAAVLVTAERPGVTFTLHGADEGSLAGVTRLITRHGLTSAVRYAGAVGHPDALRRLAEAAVYVLPSRSEVFPVSLLEALAAGTPTVCTEGCAIAGELAARGATVVTDGTPRALADAVLGLLQDPGHARGVAAAGLRAVDELYSAAAVADRLEKLYAEHLDAVEPCAEELNRGA